MDENEYGLYKDNGLLDLRNVNGKQIDRDTKNVIQLFKNFGFLVDIETSLKILDFFDIMFDLNNGALKPYKKPNDTFLYT